MNIVHLTNNDFDGGGRAVRMLHEALRRIGEDSRMLVYRKKSSGDDTIVQVSEGHPIQSPMDIIRYNVKFLDFLFKKLRWKLAEILHPSDSIFNYNQRFLSFKTIEKYIRQADVICLYSIQHFVDTKLIEEIMQNSNAPVFWTTMDMEPLAGGCHFNHGCTRFQQDCRECPQIKSSDRDDTAHRIWQTKKDILGKQRITFVAASQWVEDHIQASSIYGDKHIERIYLGTDGSVFKKGSKKEARQSLGLSQDAKIVLFGCFNIHDERKGGAYLVQALEKLQDKIRQFNPDDMEHVTVLTFGRESKEFLPENIKCKQVHLGMIHENTKVAAAFQAADVFASPSVDDFGPVVVVEAFMCEVPIVAFNLGVAPDLLLTDQDGYIADLHNTDQFADGLYQCLFNMKRSETKPNPVREQCDYVYQAKAYKDLFQRNIQKEKLAPIN